MELAKKLNFSNIVLFLFLILFPFGQIVRIGIIHPIDVIAGVGGLYAVFKRFKRPKVFKFFENFLFVTGFTWFFSIFLFKQVEVLYGLLYLFRLGAYFYFFLYVWNFVEEKKSNRNLLTNSLFSLTVVSAIFGWIQYFMIPDIKPFFTWGWDEHLFRLVGTFLDPTFLGLIIVFGLIISIERKKWLTTVFLLISLAFTYSRASYLAFLAGLTFLAFSKGKFKEILLAVVTLVFLVFLLPTAKNHSIVFYRSFSAIARLENYQTTLKIFQKAPIFGVGYNNLCIAYQKYIGPQSFGSHACSGSDASLLFVLAATGVNGLASFLALIFGVAVKLKDSYRGSVLAVICIAALVHSFFSNSLFYPWILGYLIVFLAAVLRNKVES